ncbi:SDR family NAD(P)-dependent oxidoreductase [Pseudenhygromyxa sp. WMMC2535]|nr:SDR family NAD(P)-dependent oxidoreductase [Pseudenhygromyxa sp. WMMC2535]NVB37538.1 SDR family NAD(P)-dependent oxidoreductase [Pseudenhygromyxa sp. WMMC2535]
MDDLSGRVALVSGGSRGIGAAICSELAAAGAVVAVNYRSSAAAATQVCGDIQAAGGRAQAFAADVGDPRQAAALVASVTESLGSVDILVHNAGLQHTAMAHKMSDQQWDEALAVNLSAAFYLSRAALPAMRAAGSGCVVFVASASGSVAQVGAAGYVAAKHGLIGLTKALALESANKGIRVNAVSPGITDTDMVADLDERAKAGLLARVPLGRMASPEEVAATVAWVIRGASYSTGNVFHVSGGVAM